MQHPILKVEHLSHRYASSWAIRDINFEISHTGILGLLGSNGAGKSTTMNILCGVLNQSEGKVFIDGMDLRGFPLEAKKQIGFLPQNPPLHLELTVDEYLIHCAHIRQIERSAIRSSVEAVKERCGVGHFSHRLLRNLSGGYRQRVGIAQAIIHRPKLVVLDEPTNGLDPNQIQEVRGIIKEIAADRAVIFSTHILSEVQAICKDIKMIEGGKVVFADTMDAFNNYIEPNSMLVSLENPPDPGALLSIPGITRAEFLTPKQVRLYFNTTQQITEDFNRISMERGWRLREMTLEKSSLDTIFAQLSNSKISNQ